MFTRETILLYSVYYYLFFIIKADLEPHLHAGLELEAWLRDGDVVVVVAVEEVGGLSEEGVMLCIP